MCINCWCDMMKSSNVDCSYINHSPPPSILNFQSSILHPLTSNILYSTSNLHPQLFFLNPQPKVYYIYLKMSSKWRDFQQNVRKFRLHRLQLFPGLGKTLVKHWWNIWLRILQSKNKTTYGQTNERTDWHRRFLSCTLQLRTRKRYWST